VNGALGTLLPLLVMLAIIFGDNLMDLARQIIGRPSKKGMSKRQAKRLQREHAEALDILREIDAYDRFADNPLPTATHDRLRGFLDAHREGLALPRRQGE
jgi:hypothetical protein